MISGALRHWFAQPWAMWLLMGLPPVLTILALIAARRRHRTLMRLGRLPALLALTEKRRPWQPLRSLCWMFGSSALILGIAGPQWGREAEPTAAPGRDLVVVLDASRSMLADDVAPSRQERAKEALLKLVRGSLQKRGGNRVALVAFAARGEIICPLTHDYDHFCDKLAELDAAQLPPDMRPGEGAVSGTRIGDGLRAAVRAHDPRKEFRGAQDILLISDGDDPVHDGEWGEGVNAAKEAGIPIHVVGVGDPDQGGRIPTRDGYYLMHNGKTVVTKLERRPLQEIARRTKGTYTEAGISPLPLEELFRGTIEPGPKREATDDALPLYQQRYPWFYGAALLFLVGEMTIGFRGKKKVVSPRAAARG